MTSSQLGGAGGSDTGKLITAICGNAIVSDSLATKLNPLDWLGYIGGDSDGIVPLTSQFDGNLQYSITTSGASQNTFSAIHSGGAASLGFLPPTILQGASGAPTQVVNLLNTAVSTPSVFVSP